MSQDLIERSRFRNINNIEILPLNFEGLPEYETTDEEEEEGQDQPEESEFHNQQAPDMMGINSPQPHQRLTNESSDKNKMNKKDYQQSIQYIERFYQQNQQQQDNSGILFDDAPKSVTEESSIFEQKRKRSPVVMQNQFDQSQQKFDDSMDMGSGMVRGFRNSEIGIGMKDAIDVLGLSIDSQSFDQSLIDQSINSRKKKVSKIKKKEDLDGSKLYRRDKSAAPDKKKKSPRKQNFMKQSLGAVVNKKGKMLEEKKSMGPGEQRARGMSISSGKSNTQMEGGEIMPEFIRSN